jgi:hypothetical protein
MANYNLIWKTNLTQYAFMRKAMALVGLSGRANAFFLIQLMF